MSLQVPFETETKLKKEYSKYQQELQNNAEDLLKKLPEKVLEFRDLLKNEFSISRQKDIITKKNELFLTQKAKILELNYILCSILSLGLIFFWFSTHFSTIWLFFAICNIVLLVVFNVLIEFGIIKKEHKKIRVNAKIENLKEILGPKLDELYEDLMILDEWIRSLEPNIQIGNNFGVEVQREILNEINDHQIFISKFLLQLHSFEHETRVKLARKFDQTGDQDFFEELLELEARFFRRIHRELVNVRDIVHIIDDIVSKNLLIIKHPRGEEHEKETIESYIG